MSGTTDPNIILASNPQFPDLNTAVTNAGNMMTLAQQGQAQRGQNALRTLYQNPANVTPTGGLTKNALRQLMTVDPSTGFQAQRAATQNADANLQFTNDQWDYAVKTVLTPAQEAYDQALKAGMPQKIAQGIGQQVYAEQFKQASSSGMFSQDQIAMAPQNFDPQRNAGFLQSWNDYQTNQRDTGERQIEDTANETRANAEAANAGLPLPFPQLAGGQGSAGTGGGGQGDGDTPAAPPTPTPGATPINNPFNLRPVGSSTGFMQFPNQGAGMQAGIADLQAQPSGTTLRSLLTKYSPPNQNNTAQLIQNAVAFTGLNPDQPLNLKDPATLSLVSGAILKQEGGLSGGGQGGPSALPQPRPNKPWTVMDMNGTQIRYQPDTGAATTLDGSQPVDVAGQTLTKPAGPSAQAVTPQDQQEIDQLAPAVANYEVAPPTGFGATSPRGMALIAAARQINPNYDETEYAAKSKAVAAFDTGKQGDAVRSFNVGISHLDTLSQLADALQNGDVQAINRIGNQVSQETGSPAPTNFDAAKAIVGDEIIKAVVGGGGALADRDNAQNQISSAKSPAQLKGVIDTYKKLMGGQLSGLQQQYTSSTGLPTSAFQAKLYPTTVQQLQLDQPAGSQQTGQGDGSAPAPGTVEDGYRFNGGDPADPKNWSKV